MNETGSIATFLQPIKITTVIKSELKFREM